MSVPERQRDYTYGRLCHKIGSSLGKRPNSVAGWDLLGRIFLVYKTDATRDFFSSGHCDVLVWCLECNK